MSYDNITKTEWEKYVNVFSQSKTVLPLKAATDLTTPKNIIYGKSLKYYFW